MFRELQTEQEFDFDKKLPGIGTYATAERLIEGIAEDAGPLYYGAVTRCLNGLSAGSISLEEGQTKDELYESIVLPLKEHLKGLTRKEMRDVFGESPSLPQGLDY